MDATDTLLLISIAVYLSVASFALVFEVVHRKAELVDPSVQFIVVYSLFVLPLPLRSYITDEIAGNVTPNLPYLKTYMPAAVLLSALGLLLFLPAYHSRLANRFARSLPYPRPGTVRGAHTAFVTTLLVSLMQLVLLGQEAGGLTDLVLRGYGSAEALFGRGYLALGFHWSFIASFFLLISYAIGHRRTDLTFFVLLFCALLLIQLVMGNRNLVVYLLLTLLMFVHHGIRPLRARSLVMIGVAIFLAANVYGFVRGAGYENLRSYFGTTADRIRLLRETGGVAQAATYTLSIGEFVVPFETFPQIIASLGSEVRPLFGLSYVRAPLFFIPSVLLPDRPSPLSNWYIEHFYGPGHGRSEGRRFFFLTEGYLNFGPAGVMLTTLLWGVALGALKEYVKRARGASGPTLLYALSIAFIYRGVSGDAVSLLVGLSTQYLLPATLGLAIASGFRRWYLIKNGAKSHNSHTLREGH